jgi:DNA-binding CsgD family transcriptional regulator
LAKREEGLKRGGRTITDAISTALAAIRKVGQGQGLTETERAILRCAPNGTIPAALASAINYSGESLNSAARHALKIATDQAELVQQIADAIAGHFKPADPTLWLSRVHHLRGDVPDAIRSAMGLGSQASWPLVAERLERHLALKRGAR